MKEYVLIILMITSCTSFAQLTQDSLLIEGNYRSFHYILSNKTNASVIFVLHGSGGDGLRMREATSSLENLISTENLILVYPNAYKKYWNECRKMSNSEANRIDINENAFFNSMIDYFIHSYKADKNKVFVVGTSGGGHMAYKLAMTMPEKFKAITAIIANLPEPENFDCYEKKMSKSIMIVNGTIDKINPYDGGDVILGNNMNFGKVRSTQNTFQYWAHLAGYNKSPTKELLPDLDPNDKMTIEKYTYKKRKKPEITLLKVLGGGHNYPKDIDVHVEAWHFFKRQL